MAQLTRLLLTALCLFTAAGPARAQGGEIVSLAEAIRRCGRDQPAPIDVDAEASSYIVAVNMSANISNGVVGQRIRAALRQLMNEFLVDGEQIALMPFQLDVQPAEPFDFTARERVAIHGPLDRVAARSGSPAGGSDVEQAQYEVLRALERSGAAGVGVVLTNHDKSQEPVRRPPGWQGLWIETGRDRELAALSQSLGVRWHKVAIAVDTPSTTWAHLVAVRGPGGTPIEGGRAGAVRRQNQESPLIPAPGMTPIRLLGAQALPPNRVRMSWEAPDYPHDGYLVRIRERDQPAVLKEVPVKSTQGVITLPGKGQFGLTVAAQGGPGGETGPESDPVIVAGEEPPSMGPWLVVLALLLLGGLLTMLYLRRPISITVADREKRTLRVSSPVGLVALGSSERRPNDVEVSVHLPPDTATSRFAEVRRTVLGAVELRTEEVALIQLPSGRSAQRLPLQAGVQTVTLLSVKDNAPLSTLTIQVGDSKRPVQQDRAATNGRRPGGKPALPPKPGTRSRK
jgi:hypothetical protein